MAQEFRIKVVVDPKGATAGIKKVDGALDRTQKKALGVGKALRSAFLFLGGAAALTGGIRLIAGFGQEMATVGAITGATAEQFAALNEEAKALGTTTRFSAQDAAEGMTFLARAGFDAEAVLASVGDTLTLAQAGALGLGEAADIASNVLTGFRLEVGEAGRVVDVLALAANSSNTNVSQLGQAMKFVAPVAAGLGVSLETATAAAGALSDAGLQASMAGTGLRKILSELESPTKNTANILATLGLTTDDVRVSQVGLVGALEKLQAAGVDTGLALEIFGDRGGPAFEVLSSSIPKVKAMTEALGDAEGTARRIADAMDNTLNGALLATKSALQGLVIELGDAGAEGALRSFFETLTTGLRAAAANIDTTVKVIEGLAFALGVSLARKAIPAVIAGLQSLKVALLTNPFTFLAGAIGLAAGALVTFRDELVIFERTGVTAGDLVVAAFQEIGARLALGVQLAAELWPIFKDAAVRSVVGVGQTVEDFFVAFGITSADAMNVVVDVFRLGFNRMIGFGSGMVTVFADLFNRLADVAAVVWEIIARSARTFWTFFGDSATGSISNVSEQLGKFAGDSKKAIGDTLEDLKAISDKLQGLELPSLEDSTLDQLQLKILQLIDPLDIANDSAAAFKEQFERDFVGEFLGIAGDGVEGLRRNFDALRETARTTLLDLGFDENEIELRFEGLFAAIKRRADANKFGPFIPDGGGEQFGPTENPGGGAITSQADALRSAASVELNFDADKQSLDGLLTSLKDEIEFLGLSNEQRILANELVDVEADGNVVLTLAKIAVADARLKEIGALERQEALLDQIHGPQQREAQAVEDLNALYLAEKISVDELTSALAGLKNVSENSSGDAAAFAALEALVEQFRLGTISAEEFTAALEGIKRTKESLSEGSDDILGGFSDGFDRAMANLENLAGVANQTVVNAFGNAENALVDFAKTGELNFEKMVDGIISDLLRLAARQALLSLIGGGGSLFGDLFGGADVDGERAEGGPVLPGRTYLVGEEGPELVTPSGSGNVIPAGETAAILGGSGGSSPTVNVAPPQINIQNVVVDDPDAIPAAMDSPAGERVFTNYLSRNKSTVKGILR